MKRAYGHEPILLDASPVLLAQKKQESPRKKWRRQYVVAIILLIVVAGAAVTAKLVNTSSVHPVLPAGIVNSAQFSLYGPAWLPTGWAIDQQSFDSTAEVVTFTISDAKGKRLVITEQPKPPESNLGTFYQQQLSGNTSLDVSVGKATLGQFEGSSLAGIATDQTWILVRAVASIEQAEFERILKGFEKAPR